LGKFRKKMNRGRGLPISGGKICYMKLPKVARLNGKSLALERVVFLGGGDHKDLR